MFSENLATPYIACSICKGQPDGLSWTKTAHCTIGDRESSRVLPTATFAYGYDKFMTCQTVHMHLFQLHPKLFERDLFFFPYVCVYQLKFKFSTLILKLILRFFSSKFIFQFLLLKR